MSDMQVYCASRLVQYWFLDRVLSLDITDDFRIRTQNLDHCSAVHMHDMSWLTCLCLSVCLSFCLICMCVCSRLCYSPVITTPCQWVWWRSLQCSIHSSTCFPSFRYCLPAWAVLNR